MEEYFFLEAQEVWFRAHVIVGPHPQPDGGHIEGVGDEVHHVPHVADVLLQPHIPQLLDLAPYQA